MISAIRMPRLSRDWSTSTLAEGSVGEGLVVPVFQACSVILAGSDGNSSACGPIGNQTLRVKPPSTLMFCPVM